MSQGYRAPRRVVAQGQVPQVVGSIVFGSMVFSAAGLYALMAVAVARRAREIGIRIAQGATPGACCSEIARVMTLFRVNTALMPK